MSGFDKCLYCGFSTTTEPNTGSRVQAPLYRVHGDLWACKDCVNKYHLETEGANYMVLEWDGTWP